jgi:hypothetical protein
VTTVQLWTGHETRPLRASSGEGRSATAADRVPVWTGLGTLVGRLSGQHDSPTGHRGQGGTNHARGHFPGDDAVVKLLWLAIINIEDKRAREREARRRQTGKRSDQPARIVEGQRVMGWREALGELDIAYPGRLR